MLYLKIKESDKEILKNLKVKEKSACAGFFAFRKK